MTRLASTWYVLGERGFVRIADRFGNLLEIAFIYDVCGFHGRYGYFVGRPCLGA